MLVRSKERDEDLGLLEYGIILLYDMHQEYTAPLGEVTGASVIFDAGEVWELSEMMNGKDIWESAQHQQKRAEVLEVLFPGLPDHWDIHGGPGEGFGVLWQIRGSRDHLEKAFWRLLDSLDVVEGSRVRGRSGIIGLSGDDDTFDYWPNTMQMLWEYAHDLDETGWWDEGEMPGHVVMLWDKVRHNTLKNTAAHAWCKSQEDFDREVWTPYSSKHDSGC